MTAKTPRPSRFKQAAGGVPHDMQYTSLLVAGELHERINRLRRHLSGGQIDRRGADELTMSRLVAELIEEGHDLYGSVGVAEEHVDYTKQVSILMDTEKLIAIQTAAKRAGTTFKVYANRCITLALVTRRFM